MNSVVAWVAGVALAGLPAVAEQGDWVYLDNGIVRIGVDKSRGAGIGYFAESRTGRNLLNHFDEGRFVQQSYYGAPDGSVFMKKPWTYNPVQGGSGIGKPSRVIEFRRDAANLYAAIEPRNWPGGGFCPEALMAQTISLTGAIAKISFRMTYTGEDQGKPRHQEMPAVFVDAALSNLVYPEDGTMKRREPGWPNESGETSEQWTAWLDDSDWGIGLYTPGTRTFTCYRFGAGATGPDVSPCSYIAPVRTFALTNGLVVEYNVYLTIGTLEEIKKRFSELKRDKG